MFSITLNNVLVIDLWDWQQQYFNVSIEYWRVIIAVLPVYIKPL